MSTSFRTRSGSSQEMLWKFTKVLVPEDPGAFGINGSGAASPHGPMDATALRLAVSDGAARHDAWRMVFTEIGVAPPIRFAERLDPPLSIVGLSDEPADVRLRPLDQLTRAGEDRAFDVRRLPLWEICPVRPAPDHHALIVSMCHLVGDGWSGELLLRELGVICGHRVGQRDQPETVRT